MEAGNPGGRERITAMKKALKIILIIIIAAVLIVGAYVAYVFLSYHRIPDKQAAEIDNSPEAAEELAAGEELSLTTWNLGFGAYVQDYSFFMDGGDESRARSEKVLTDNMEAISDTLAKYDSNLYLLQEVDFDGTRTLHVDECRIIREHFSEMSYAFAQNYDSPYLFYPVTSPHGANKSGIVTLSEAKITDSLRRSLPIQSGFHKILDLDRCFSVSRIPVDDGRELVLINAHLSAYTTDPKVNEKQLNMLYDTMLREYEAGNYVICGGDFNKDLLGNSPEHFEGVALGADENWCQPFPVEDIPDSITLVAAYDAKAKTPSCRNTDTGYVKGETFVCTVDGFLVTDNVAVTSADVRNEEFMCSDHNPVTMKFVMGK